MYRLGRVNGLAAQLVLWSYINDGLLSVVELGTTARRLMQNHMTKYGDLPCDLADASLLALAEMLNAQTVFSIDSDFYVFVLTGGKTLDVVPGPR